MKLSPGQMGGVVVKAESVAGLRLTETFCAPNHRAPKHWHELFHFCLIRDGSYTEYCGSRVRECAAYSLISHPPGETHSSLYHSRGASSLVIEIEGSLLELARQHSVVLEEAVYFRSGTPVWLGARLYDEFRRMDKASPLTIQGLTLELMAAASRQTATPRERKPPRWLGRAIEILRSSFPNEPSLSGLAQAVGVHPVHLARTFRRHHNCTLGEYVRRLRIEAACRKLSLTDVPLSQIAFSVGYCDQSHFSRNFKKSMGMTPARYRAAFRSR
jgi:AraC family transcriptional regulator